jgi:hypothetical protein
MRLDADEIIEEDLVQTLLTIVRDLPSNVVGLNFNRKHIFMGRWIKHGGRFPLTLLRMWRSGYGRIEDRWMDEHIVIWGGRSITIDGGFSDANENDLSFFTAKHNKYATREALDVLGARLKLFAVDEAFSVATVSLQAGLKRHLKEKIYNRLPFWVGPLGYFLYRYFIQLGFLDGRPGLIYHFLQGFWYRFLVGAKVEEFEHALRDCKTPEEQKNLLANLTGLTIE